MRAPFLFLALLLSSLCIGDPVIHKFAIWGTIKAETEKLAFLTGFTNGLFAGPRGPEFLDMANCLQKMDSLQLIAMVDKYYREHPEKWSQTASDGVIAALTVTGGSCEGKAKP